MHGAELLGDLNRGDQIRASRNAREDALLPAEARPHAPGVDTVDSKSSVDQGSIQEGALVASSEPLRRQGFVNRFDRDHLDRGKGCLERPAHAGQPALQDVPGI